MQNISLQRETNSLLVNDYEMISTILTVEGTGYVTFGVRFFYGGFKGATMDIPDISADKAIAEEFARRCVHGRVSINHVYEVLEDYLGIAYGI